MIGQLRRRVSITSLASVLMGLAIGMPSTPASAFAGAPGWVVTARNYPTNVLPGGKGTIAIKVFNVGAAGSNGAITVTDTLPPGLTATDAGEAGTWGGGTKPHISHSLWNCTGNGQGERRIVGATVVTCTNLFPSFAGGGGWPNKSQPDPQPEISIAVDVAPGLSEGVETNQVVVAGGGSISPASTRDEVAISSKSPAFGFESWDAWFSNADGTVDTQAGSHPYEATFNFDLAVESAGEFLRSAGGEIRTVAIDLPPGLVGNPTAVPQCSRQLFEQEACPGASQVGIVVVRFELGALIPFQLYNLVPPRGVPAEFAFNVNDINTFVDAKVRTGGDYGITTSINNAPQRTVIGATTTIWGVPGDPSHDTWRIPAALGGCGVEEINRSEKECFSTGYLNSSGERVGVFSKPFLTLPTSCAGPQTISIRASTWQEPIAEAQASVLTHDSEDEPTGFAGCQHLDFGPPIAASPDTANADTPAGLTVEIKPPVGDLSDASGLGTSDIENATVTLPEGMVINPGQAAGLQACQADQDGLTSEAERAEGNENDGQPSCPLASKVGTAEAETPLLKSNLLGNVYLLQSEPPNLRLLLALSGEGVNVKLVIEVHLDETTGRLTATVKSVPGVPVSDFKLSFSGGGQAALATPTECGSYTTSADFTPWASPFVADFEPLATFAITKGTGNAPCPSSPLPFSPSLVAGSTTDQAGGFTDFSLLLQAPDDQQRIEKLQFKVPSGLLGMISQVPLCGESQAADGTCSSASQIGHTVVASGPGPYPLVVPQPGQPPAAIYLTGPYRGAPFGLSIVVPIHVGPFTLPTQVVRAKIEVDPLTSQITVTTDPFPQVIAGVPTDLRTVNAVVDRPGFMFNPTNCSPMSFSGTAWGTPPPGVGGPGSKAAIGSHFQMGSCQALKFKPDFKVATSGKTSRKNGASLDVTLAYPKGPFPDNQASIQSNIAKVKVDLPKQLPSRLTTLQKACPSETFEANPAACPAASRVGQVAAVTPVLPVKLTGPAYFVSYGGAKFPELVFVLQGYGVTVQVHAETFISKAGITSSTLRRVPDVPIESFELKLPQGPFSALAASGNLCKAKLVMPTAFTAQNGAEIHQNTPINATGCQKHKAKEVTAEKRKGAKRKNAKGHGAGQRKHRKR